MGPVWYKQSLINIIAFVVALNMAVGVVAISARREQGSMAMAGHVKKPAAGSPPAETKNGEILAGGQVDRQRQTGAEPAGAQAPAASGSSGPTGTTGAAVTAPTAPATSAPTSSRRRTTDTTARRARPSTGGTTPTTAPASVDATGGEGAVTTAPPAAEPGSTVQPGGDTAPAPTTTTTTKRPAAPGPSTQSFDDAGGDTVVESSKAAKALPRADLIRSKANYTAKALLLAVQTAEAIDPRQDPRWASVNTYVSWDLDTNLDGTVDYIVEYFVEGGQLGADVTRADDASATSLCGVEAALSSDGYTVALDPTCLGNPAAFAYRATIYYDTASEVVTDVAPDTAFSRSVGRPKS